MVPGWSIESKDVELGVSGTFMNRADGIWMGCGGNREGKKMHGTTTLFQA
jgi:hypothetical protein